MSWYIRPLFIIPIVAGAYKKSYAVLKVLHSIFFSGEYGLSIIRPAVAGLIVCIAAIVFFIKKKR